MKIAVSTESTLDLTKELIAEYDIKTIPFEFIIDDKCYTDGEITIEELFNLVDNSNSFPKTNAINAYTFAEYFNELKKEYDAVIHITLSSGISCTYNNAKQAAEEVGNVFVVDSLSLSSAIGLLAIYARQLSKTDMQPQEIVAKLEERKKSLKTSFVIEKLDYLHKGGRCSSIALLGANLLKIRPRIVLTSDGKMVSDKKYRGKMEQVIDKYFNESLAEFNNPDKSVVMLTYTTATEEMLSVAKQALENAGFEKILITRAGCTIACHCGDHTLGFIMFNDGGKTL